MPDPLVSVIIPTYNYGQFLQESVESVLGQSYTNLEVIVVDDGSTDRTASVLDTITDNRVIKLNSAHQGVSAARNLGIDRSSGDFLAFLDADDRWLPDKIAHEIRLAIDASLDVVFCNFRRFDRNGFLPRDHFSYFPSMSKWPSRHINETPAVALLGDAFRTLAPQPFLAACLPATIFRKAPIEKLRFPPELRIAEDWHYMLRVFERTAVGYVNLPLVEVRRHGSNSYKRNEDLAPMVRCLYDVEQYLCSEEHKSILRRKRGVCLLGLGHFNLWEGNLVDAVSAYARATAYEGSRFNAIRHLAFLPIYAMARPIRIASKSWR